MRPGFGGFFLMPSENDAGGNGTVRPITVLGSDGTKLFRHPNVVDIAKDVLQRLQLLHERLDILAREGWRKELDQVTQLLQGAAHFVFLFRFKLVDSAATF